MERSQVVRGGSVRVGALCAAVAVLVGGCASGANNTTPTALTKLSASDASAVPSGSASTSTSAAAGGAVTATTTSGAAANSSATKASATSSASAGGALPASAAGDRQKPVELMTAVGASGLPIHRTADLGASSRVYQAIAAKYRDVLVDLSATGYGDAESTASTYIVVLGQFKQVRPVPNVVDGTLAALGATKVVAETKLGAHADKYSLVMSCGVLPNTYSLCVWMGGTNGNLFLGAFEAPSGVSLADTAAIAESVFGYVAP